MKNSVCKSVTILPILLGGILLLGCNPKELNGFFSDSISSSEALTAPKNVMARFSSESSITLSWEAGSGNPTGYKIAYSNSSTPPTDCNQGTLIGSQNISGTSHTVEGLTPMGTYSFSVCAINEVQETEATNGPNSTTITPSQVEPVYPGFSDWTDFVVNDGTTPYDATGSICTSPLADSTPQEFACIHAALIKKIEFPSMLTCDPDFEVTDEFEFQQWVCDDSGGHAIYYSTGFKPEGNLTQYIDTSGSSPTWAQTFVRFSHPEYSGQSEPTEWWSNTFTPLPTGTGALSSSKTIYYLTTDRTDGGHPITSDNVILVTLDGATLSTSGANVITANTNNFMWIEGSYSGGTADTISFNTVRFPNLRQVSLTGATESGLQLTSVSGGEFHYLNVYENAAAGAILEGSSRNAFSNSLFATNLNGVRLTSSSDSNYFRKTRMLNNTQNGVQGDEGHRNAFVGSLMANNGNHGLYYTLLAVSRVLLVQSTFAGNNARGANLEFVNFSTLHMFTALNNTTSGLDLNTNDENTITSVITANNGGTGIRFLGADDNVLANILSTNNGADGIYMNSGTENNSFLQNVVVGNNTNDNCNIDTATNPGVADVTCATTANLVTGIDLSANTYVGQVSSDSANNADTAGSALASTLTFNDWLNFDNFYRVWQIDSLSMVTQPTAPYCDGADNCHIFDYSMADNIMNPLRGSSLSGTMNSAPPFVSGTCPSAVQGDINIRDKHNLTYYQGAIAEENTTDAIGNDDGICEAGEACYNRYLVNAGEILFDRIGDDDGLCESGESCFYQQGFGAYAGHGDLETECTFVDGVGATPVVGVTMKIYSQWGY